jgi:hypothetical protein
MKRKTFQLIGAMAIWTLVLGGVEALAQRFVLPVRHDHLIGSCTGELIITGDGVEYRTAHKQDARRWGYPDIKMIELKSAREIKVLTYESTSMKVGGDKTFEFKVRKRTVPQALSDFLLARVARPLATSLVGTEKGSEQYAFPVRHRHTFGGEQGTLKIYEDGVVYESMRPASSRRWRWEDIRSISRTGPYQLAITTYEPKFGGPTKTLNFDLKERMDDEVYDYLWARIYKVTLPVSAESKRQAFFRPRGTLKGGEKK